MQSVLVVVVLEVFFSDVPGDQIRETIAWHRVW